MTENFPGYTFTYLPERQSCMNKNIIVIYTQSGFTLDTEAIKDKQFYENAQLLTDFAKNHTEHCFTTSIISHYYHL